MRRANDAQLQFLEQKVWMSLTTITQQTTQRNKNNETQRDEHAPTSACVAFSDKLRRFCRRSAAQARRGCASPKSAFDDAYANSADACKFKNRRAAYHCALLLRCTLRSRNRCGSRTCNVPPTIDREFSRRMKNKLESVSLSLFSASQRTNSN